MKQRKRVWALLLVLAMVLSLTACKKEQTPEEVYTAAIEKMNALSGMDMEMDMTVSMTDGTETLDITLSAKAKMQNLNQEDMAMDMLMEMGLMGMSLEIQTYYADGYYLMDMMGQKLKYAMPLEDAMKQAAVSQEPAADLLSELTMTEENNTKVLTYKVDATKLTEESAESYTAVLEGLGMGDLSGTQITFQLMEGTMDVNKDGYATAASIHMVYSTDVEGTPLDYDIQVDVVYNNPGQDVTVEIPDASEYMEIDPSMLEG